MRPHSFNVLSIALVIGAARAQSSPPVAYSSVSSPSPYTSMYTIPPYIPSGSSELYTPPIDSSVYSPPVHTSFYSPPHVPSGDTSVSSGSSGYTPPASYKAPEFTSVAYPTYSVPTASEYTPTTYVPGPGETSYAPATNEPTYTPPDPYSSATAVTVVDDPKETGTFRATNHNSARNDTTNGTNGGNSGDLGFTPVIGPPGLELRLPIDELQSQFPDVWNMFLIGLEAMMAVEESLDLSYYQISGIHGRPFIPWQYPASSAQMPNRGYCTHASALFSTWHRPYLSLVEQTLVSHAVAEANKFTGSDAQKYQDAAKKVRLPYWDWASESTKSHLPSSMMVETISVVKPAAGASETVVIPNPLYSYTFTRLDYRMSYFQPGIFATTSSTRRQPDGTGTSRNAVADREMANTYDARRQNTYNLFSIPTFQGFTSNAWDGGSSPRAWTSVESIHNSIHANLGGSGGHMSYVDYAAFDPIFWLHHCNVDRLTAMYQAVWPGKVVEPQRASGTFARRPGPNDMDDINTPLYPFRHSSGAEWTSQDVSTARSIFEYGYAYPEVPAEFQGQGDEELKDFTTAMINELYSPMQPRTASVRSAPSVPSEGRVRSEWIALVAFDTADIPGDFEVLMFAGDVPHEVEYWKMADSLVGESATFGADMPMHNVIQASIPLTQVLIDKGIGLDSERAVKFLKEECHWVIKQGGYSVPLSELKSLKVAVTSTEVQYPDDKSQLAIWGQSYIHTEVTEGKEGGMQPNETYLVQGEVAPPVLNGTTADPNQAPSTTSTTTSPTYASTTPARSKERSRPWRML